MRLPTLAHRAARRPHAARPRRLQCVELLALARNAGLGVEWLVAIAQGLFERLVDLHNFDRVMRAVNQPQRPSSPSMQPSGDVMPLPPPPGGLHS